MNVLLKNKLEEMNKTPYWLHKQTDITYACILKLLNNKSTSISWNALERICNALNCTPNDILQIDSNNTKNMINLENLVTDILEKKQIN